MPLLIVAHFGTPEEHIAHLERCEGCGILGPCCAFEQVEVFGQPNITLPMCKDTVNCGLRIHIVTHEPGRPYLDCAYCVSGTNVVLPEPAIPDTVQEILDLIDGNPWNTEGR